MAADINNPKLYTRVPIAKATTVERGGLYNIYVDDWWIVTPEEEILFYRGYAAQCNTDVNVATHIKDKLYPGCSVRQIKNVFVPANQSDYL